MSQDRAQWRRKISEWSSAVANPHRGRSTSEWVSECNNVKEFTSFNTGHWQKSVTSVVRTVRTLCGNLRTCCYMHVMSRPITGRVRILVHILPIRHFAVRKLPIAHSECWINEHNYVVRVFTIRSVSRLPVVRFAIARLRNHLEIAQMVTTSTLAISWTTSASFTCSFRWSLRQPGK